MENRKHTITYIKLQAKKIKKEQGLSHTQSLELSAKGHGFSNWMHCQRMLSQKAPTAPELAEKLNHKSFTDWLKSHKNRDSPLGDLAQDVMRDIYWPLYDSLEHYQDYLNSRSASIGAISALNGAWKSYTAYLHREIKSPKIDANNVKNPSKNQDLRRVVIVKNVTPIPFTKRTTEKFVEGDKAWISWDGRKAIPVTITEVDETHYSFRIERPINKAGSSHFLFLDEVRSTPELACINHVTL